MFMHAQSDLTINTVPLKEYIILWANRNSQWQKIWGILFTTLEGEGGGGIQVDTC